MKIQPNSVVGQRLLGFGVTGEEMVATHVFRWDWQFGAAVTLPLSKGAAVILAKSRYAPQASVGVLSDGRHVALIRHEFCHVRQIREWGALNYIGRHIAARIKTRSILARESDVERSCYEAQARAEAEYKDS